MTLLSSTRRTPAVPDRVVELGFRAAFCEVRAADPTFSTECAQALREEAQNYRAEQFSILERQLPVRQRAG